MNVVLFQAKCVYCKHKWNMSSEQVEAAKLFGVASCPKCASPATVEKIELAAKAMKARKG